jgi:hypothetical protein
MANGTSITVVNKSKTDLIFSDFNAGDSGVPFDHTWVKANSKGELKVGGFSSLGVGVQAQSGGVWLDGDPKAPPYVTPGQTFTFTMTKDVS